MTEDEAKEWMEAHIQDMKIQHAKEVENLLVRLQAVEAESQKAAQTPALNTPSSSIMESVVRSKAHLPNIDKFDGKDLSMYPQFEGMLKAKLEIDGKSIGGPEEQVWYGFGRLTGDAASRMFPWISYAKEEGTLTVENFLAQMRTAFADPRQEQKALNTLNRTKMRGTPLGEFLNDFNRLILEAHGWKWPDAVKKGYLKAALPVKLLSATIGMKEEESYEDYCNQLRMVADQMVEINEVTTRRQWAKSNAYNRTNQNSAPAGEAMDWEPTPVSAVRTTQQRKHRHNDEQPWGSRAEIQTRRQKGNCIRCGQKGHFVADCTVVLSKSKPIGHVSKKHTKTKVIVATESSDESGDSYDPDTDSGNE